VRLRPDVLRLEVLRFERLCPDFLPEVRFLRQINSLPEVRLRPDVLRLEVLRFERLCPDFLPEVRFLRQINSIPEVRLRPDVLCLEVLCFERLCDFFRPKLLRLHPEDSTGSLYKYELSSISTSSNAFRISLSDKPISMPPYRDFWINRTLN
jgi:hypothetical protein